MRTRSIVGFALALAFIGAAASAARASESDGQVTLGLQYWTQTVPEAKYREYTDPSRGFFPSALEYRNWSEKNFLGVQGFNLNRRDEALGLRLAHGVCFQLDVTHA